MSTADMSIGRRPKFEYSPNTTAKSIAGTPFEYLGDRDIGVIADANQETLQLIADYAKDQEPPNTPVLAAVGASSVVRQLFVTSPEEIAIAPVMDADADPRTLKLMVELALSQTPPNEATLAAIGTTAIIRQQQLHLTSPDKSNEFRLLAEAALPGLEKAGSIE